MSNNQAALGFIGEIAENIQGLARMVRHRPFLLHKVQDAAVLLLEVHESLTNEVKG